MIMEMTSGTLYIMFSFGNSSGTFLFKADGMLLSWYPAKNKNIGL